MRSEVRAIDLAQRVHRRTSMRTPRGHLTTCAAIASIVSKLTIGSARHAPAP
jgi:hypothetical protein